MTITLRAGGASDVGQVRSINQDSMLVGPHIYVVADGMGGHQGGEVASAMAIDAFDHGENQATVTVNELVGRVQDANGSVYERSGEDPGLSGMGTTLVAIAVVKEDGEERLAIVNVGDSRAYRLSGGQLDQVSDDHSLVGEMVREGRITDEQARDHPQKNIVTRAVGIEPAVDVDEFQLLPHAGDRYLLCSDGLTDEVTDAEIAGTAFLLLTAGNETTTNLIANMTMVLADDADLRRLLVEDPSRSHHSVGSAARAPATSAPRRRDAIERPRKTCHVSEWPFRYPGNRPDSFDTVI